MWKRGVDLQMTQRFCERRCNQLGSKYAHTGADEAGGQTRENQTQAATSGKNNGCTNTYLQINEHNSRSDKNQSRGGPSGGAGAASSSMVTPCTGDRGARVSRLRAARRINVVGKRGPSSGASGNLRSSLRWGRLSSMGEQRRHRPRCPFGRCWFKARCPVVHTTHARRTPAKEKLARSTPATTRPCREMITNSGDIHGSGSDREILSTQRSSYSTSSPMEAAAGVSAGSDGGRRPLRVFFLPFFARGHLIPMTDLACRMAAARPAEVEATMVVTPANATLIATTVTRAVDAGHAVRLLRYPFPDVGLESGVECLGTVAQHDAWRVFRAVDLSQPIHEKLLLEHRPDAVVADVPFWWVTDIAAKIGVPRLTFHPVGIFAQLAMNNLYAIRSDIIRDGVAAPSVIVPGMPGKEIAIPPSELPEFLLQDAVLSMEWDNIKAAQLAGFGVIVNTFADLEKPYCDEYRRVDARRAYFIRELALGLEASNKPFLWVVRSEDSDGLWAPEGWEQRVADRGMVVRGWAPQLAVLAHPSVGAFLTHCGWNSVLEAASAGLPVLTWPLVFEQFINERLVTEVATFGARLWDGGKRNVRVEDADTVPAEAIGRAGAGVMEGGERWEKMRARAWELAERARAAVSENGSSWRDLHRVIDDLTEANASRVHSNGDS
uniref:Cytokinin-O-glucosyltransferase 3 n=1 Tax=Aegilops tauschii TaxID=37682 RepID=N1R556_AEGTA